MTIDILREKALSFSGVTEEIKWDHNLCFCVGGKLFLIINPDNYPVSASFRVMEEMFNELTSREGIIQAPYFAKHKWVMVEQIEMIGKIEWFSFIESSYQIIFKKLSKKAQLEIQLK